MPKTRKIYQTNSDEVMITDAKKEILEKHAKTLTKKHVTVMVKLINLINDYEIYHLNATVYVMLVT